jgi:hypothetical protein
MKRNRIFRDGNQWCAVYWDFVNIQQSSCGFGKTLVEAIKNLLSVDDRGKYEACIQP